VPHLTPPRLFFGKLGGGFLPLPLPLSAGEGGFTPNPLKGAKTVGLVRFLWDFGVAKNKKKRHRRLNL